jgi:hypothetical protein
VSRRRNKKRREARRTRPRPDLFAPSAITDTPTMTLAEKMDSWRKMKEREAKGDEPRS